MESIGEKLRLSREEKGFSIDRVARDTNVARKYLEALENEDFETFPGEPYLIGFLRIYSEYLGLDPQTIISLYKNFKIQEQPVPMDELLNKKDPRPFIIGGIIAVSVVLVGLLVYILVPVIGRAAEKAKIRSEQSIDIDELMTFNGPGMLEEFSVNQGLKFDGGSGENTLVVRSVNRDGTVDLTIPGESISLGINQEKTFTLIGSAGKTYSVLVSDVYTGRESASLYINRIDAIASAPAAGTADGNLDPEVVDAATSVESQDQAAGTNSAATTAEAANTAGTQSTSNASGTDNEADTQTAVQTEAVESAANSETPDNEETPVFSGRDRAVVVILTSDRPLPFSFQVSFDADCMFRYQIDGTDETVGAFYEQGEMLRLNPRRKIAFWASNAGGFNLSVNNRTVQVGQHGEVVAREISWSENENREYALELYSQDL